MTLYRCYYEFMGALVVIEVQHDAKSCYGIDDVAEALGAKLGMDFLYREDLVP